jgi:hypothetical protein
VPRRCSSLEHCVRRDSARACVREQPAVRACVCLCRHVPSVT